MADTLRGATGTVWVRGERGVPFEVRIGSRQGDPAAPVQYNMVADALHCLMAPKPRRPPPLPPPPPPPSRSEKEAGDEGSAGKKAVAKAIKAPQPKIPISTKPAPQASSTGSANTSGAANQGNGTGAGRNGDGTGAGGNGTGMGGGGAVSKPSVRSGEINDSRDFPVPPGGRQARFGKQVRVYFTVTTDGRAINCTVASSGVDAETTARVCPLVVQRIRFNPAKRADGTPVESRYGYKVDFTAR